MAITKFNKTLNPACKRKQQIECIVFPSFRFPLHRNFYIFDSCTEKSSKNSHTFIREWCLFAGIKNYIIKECDCKINFTYLIVLFRD